MSEETQPLPCRTPGAVYHFKLVQSEESGRDISALHIYIPQEISIVEEQARAIEEKLHDACEGILFNYWPDTFGSRGGNSKMAENNKNMNFGQALEFIKRGYKVQRAGWNGKDMWIAFSPGGEQLHASNFWSPANREYAHTQPNHSVDVLPCITMKTADNKILMGWLASQTDMLAEDWQQVE